MPWKDTQSRSKQKKRVKFAVFVLGLICGILILSWMVQFITSLLNPLGIDSKKRNYIWNGEFNINLVVKTARIDLLSYNPKEKKITIIKIPDNLFIDVPFGFGKWQLRSVFDLGQSQKGIGGDQLLKNTLTGFFALPIDGFLDLNRFQSASEVVEAIRKNPFSGFELLSTFKTDLSVFELIRLKIGLYSVRFDKIKVLDLMDLGVLDKENLPDGTEVVITDPVKLDSVLVSLADPAIVSERKTIAVFNATDRIQLANKWARLITNLGGNVIITTNAKERLKKTGLQGEKSRTYQRINQIFSDLDCQNNPKCDIIKSQNEDIASSRAQINLFIGEDYANK